ncbi:MAG TPA: O-antigen ligase family protein [Vicinamibacterales bacterium]|nr:O-antigen ligase family protein [Vicinamibacterales bacterium]
MTRNAVLVAAIPLGALAALGGMYASSTLPLLVAAGGVFVMTGAAGVFSRETRWLDVTLVVFLVAAIVQSVPLPPGIVQVISPHASRLQTLIQLATGSSWRTLTIDQQATRDGVATIATALFVFWAAREAFARGGTHAAIRLVAMTGAVAAVVAVAARITAPGLILWTWQPIDPNATPYGPIVNPNHFATWLLMAGGIAAGDFAARIRSRWPDRSTSRRLLVHDLLAEGTVPLLALCTAAILLAVIASGSRGALAGLVVAALTAFAASRRIGVSRQALVRGSAVLAVAFTMAIWVNADVIAGRMVPGTEVRRSTIWHETLPIVRDFPIAGTGLGTFKWAMMSYQQSKSERLFNQAHDEYLQLIAEGGVLLALPALAAVAAWLVLAVRRLRDDRRDAAALRIAAFAGLAGVAMQCVWDAALRVPANALMLAWLAALVVHERHLDAPSGGNQEGRRRMRGGTAGLSRRSV